MYTMNTRISGNVSVNIQDNTTWEINKNLELPQYVQIRNLFTLKNTTKFQKENIELNWLNDTNDKTELTISMDK